MQENKLGINVLLIIIMVLVVVACILVFICFTNDVEIIEAPKEEILFSEENYPRIDGAAVMLPLAEAFKSNFTGIEISDIEVKHSKSHTAYVNLINKQTDLILVTYPTETEKQIAKSQGVELEIVPIVKDAFVFFVNSNNPIENLTLNQIKNIYSGKIKNWKDIGGEDAEILAYQRPENSLSQTGMQEFVMKGTRMIEPIKETISRDRVDIIDIISDYDNSKNSIGYSYHYYANTMYTNNSIRLLSVNGIKPTYDNIQTGLYDLQTTYYAVIRKDELENSNTRKLLNAMMSEKGQNIAKEAGYVQNY